MNKKIIFFLFLTLLLLLIPLSQNSSPSYAGSGNEVGINLGAHWDATAIRMAHDITRDGGWVVLLITPGSADALTATLKAAAEYKMNVVLRLYNGGRVFTPNEAKAWVATLGCSLTNSASNLKVYIMPWNEPFMDGEHDGIANNRGAIAQAVIDWIHALKQELDASSVSNRAALLSPMFNQFGTSTGSVFENVGEILSPSRDPDFYTHFVGAAMNLYGQYSDYITNGGSLTGDGIRNGQGYRTNVLCALGVPNCNGYPVFAIESGVGIVNKNPFVRYADAQREIIDYYQRVYKQGGTARLWENDANFKMFAIFSYDPLSSSATDWIWGSSVAGYFSGVSTDGPMETGPAMGNYESWLSGNLATLEKCSNVNCGYIPSGQSQLCNPVHGGVVPGSGMRQMCFITPSPSQYGGTITSFIDPDCPGRIVSPNISIYPMNPPGSHFCITFTKTPDRRCVPTADPNKKVTYRFTIDVHCPAGKEISGIVINDPLVTPSTIAIQGTIADATVIIPSLVYTPGLTEISAQIPSSGLTNTATLTASYAGSAISLTATSRVITAPDCSHACGFSCPSSSTYVNKHTWHLCDGETDCGCCGSPGCGTCHYAIDFWGYSNVYAPTCGTVTFAQWMPWGGEIDIAGDDGNTYQLLHLTNPTYGPVRVGDYVYQGDLIGTTYNGIIDHYSSGPHLHFAIRSGGAWIDPKPVLDSHGCVGTYVNTCPRTDTCFTCCH